MALTHADVLKIQSAIDAYEKKFPAKPSPSAAEALAWQANKRGVLDSPDKKPGGRFLGSLKLTAVRWLATMNVFKRPSAIS